MANQELLLTEVELREIGNEDCAAYWELRKELYAERQPADPPIPYEMFVSYCRDVPSFFKMYSLLIRAVAGGPVIAAADLGFDTSDPNPHAAQFSIEVHPAHRGHGLGRRLLAWVANVAQQHGYENLIVSSYEHAPSGGELMRRVGAQPSLENHQSQLVLAELDRNLLARWQSDADEIGSGFELLFWDNHYPEEHIEAFTNLGEVLNTVPRGDLEIEDQKITPAHIHERAVSTWARGGFFWTIVARETATGQLAGFTEIFGAPSQPTILYQGATVVRPAYPINHLARWMKAAMLDLILTDLPDARVIRTGNASSNAPMLDINAELGFTPSMLLTVWQVRVDQVRAFVQEKPL